MTRRTDDEESLLLAFIVWLPPTWSNEQCKTVLIFCGCGKKKKAWRRLDKQ